MIEKPHWQDLVAGQGWSIRIHQFGFYNYERTLAPKIAAIDLSSPFVVVDSDTLSSIYRELLHHFKQCEFQFVNFDRSSSVSKEHRFYAMACMDAVGELDLGNFTYAVGNESYSFNSTSLYQRVI